MEPENLVRPDWSQQSFAYYATKIEQVLGVSETASGLSVMRVEILPGMAPPLHVHTREDEFWIVLRGRLRWWFGGNSLAECTTQDAGVGAFVAGPRNIPHTFDTITDTAEVLTVLSPGEMESYFHAVGASPERHDDENANLMTSYGITVLGPAPNLHSDRSGS